MITPALLRLFYEAASMQRWNDHIRPAQGFTELDKQAHKMVFAYVLGKFEELDRGAELNWDGIIQGGMCEFMHRIKLTDIKPQVYHRLMQERGKELNKWVIDNLELELSDIGDSFKKFFLAYFEDPSLLKLEKKILRASHYLATQWEFRIIYNLNQPLYGLEQTRESVENELENHSDLAGVQKLALGKKTSHFMDLVGQLRFQQRWAHSPRIPQTSVLGHELIVAMLAYVSSLEIGACSRRKFNNYFGGLFHDLPELLTRDIVSPVKRSIPGLEDIIKDLEEKQVEEKLLPLLPPAWHPELLYYIENEFRNKIVEQPSNGRWRVRLLEPGQDMNFYNQDSFNPYDGEMVKACDDLAAFMEAKLSTEHGIRSAHLEDGMQAVVKKYEGKTVQGIDFGKIIAEVLCPEPRKTP